MRVVIAEDHVISRVGLSQILRELGHEVVAEATTGPEAVAAVVEHRPAVAILDIRMPPTNTDEGLVAAEEVARLAPSVRVLVLSQHLEPAFALRLLADDRGGVGYLLKERVLDVSVLEDALRRLVRDECVIDPEIVARLVNRPRVRNPLAALSDREREVLGELAQGRSNAAIAKVLFMAERTVEAHTTSIFTKLGCWHLPTYIGVCRQCLPTSARNRSPLPRVGRSDRSVSQSSESALTTVRHRYGSTARRR